MSIWNKVLLGCIFVTALALFVLSARALQAHRYWRESYNAHEKAIAAEQERAKNLLDGDSASGEMGLRQVSFELYKLLIGRGRVLTGARPMEVTKDQDPATKQDRIRIRIETAVPNAAESQSVLHAFEEKPTSEGGRYLGQFTVANVAGTQLELNPSVQLSPAELKRVQDSQQAGTTWRLLELMPADSHEILAGLSDDEIKAMFPESSFAEYSKDGKVMLKQDAEQMGLRGKVLLVDENGNIIRNEQGVETEVTDGKGMYVRQLRDYSTLFSEMRRLRSNTQARIEIANRDKQFLDESLADARGLQQARQQEIQDLQQELTLVRRERDAVQNHQTALAAAIDTMKQAIDNMMATNEATVAEIARIQSEAARIINARTVGVAQTEAQ